MYVHHPSKLVYLANPRTGSTSTAKALMELGFEQIGKHHEAREMGKDWVSFAVVRNHWDTAVSWISAYNLPMTVESIETALNNEYISEHKMWDYHHPDITLRYEDLENGLRDILEPVGLGPVNLPRENVSLVRKGRHYWQFYNTETRDYISERFQDEIASLGYNF